MQVSRLSGSLEKAEAEAAAARALVAEERAHMDVLEKARTAAVAVSCWCSFQQLSPVWAGLWEPLLSLASMEPRAVPIMYPPKHPPLTPGRPRGAG